MSQRTYRARGYAALVKALEEWHQLSASALVERIGMPPNTSVVEFQGEEFTLDIAVSWANSMQSAVRIHGVASGPSHWQIERVEEGLTVSLEGKEKN